MTALLAAVGAALGVFAAWEAAAGADRVRALRAIGRGLAPARAAAAGGHDPSEAERRRLLVVAALVVGAAGVLLAGTTGAAGGLLCAPALATFVRGSRRRRWRRRLDAGAPAALSALADTLAAGYGLPAALAASARDGALDRPARELLATAAGAIALGAPVAAALEGVRDQAARGGTWDAAVAAVLLQRESGGDLVSLLRDLAAGADGVAHELADARAASAQARLTARIVLGLPALACALLVLASPALAGSMLTHPLSLMLLTSAGILQIVALASVRRITSDRER